MFPVFHSILYSMNTFLMCEKYRKLDEVLKWRLAHIKGSHSNSNETDVVGRYLLFLSS